VTELERQVRLAEAQSLLRQLNFDPERHNERSALVLLALLDLQPDAAWASATNPLIGVWDIMAWVREEYGKDYAANTRETIRRRTLHQFEDASLIVSNPDRPQRPINSPKWCYQVTPRALEVIRSFGTEQWPKVVRAYLAELPGLNEMYARVRDLQMIPVTLPDGKLVELTPGGQNVLIRQIVDGFCSRWTPGGEVIYVGDAGKGNPIYEKERLRQLGVELDKHGKFPDLVIYLPEQNWLVLIEAASSHGPVDEKRHAELTELFVTSTAGLVFVSCFRSRAVMRKYLSAIAWETEVWCADAPSHLIHFNGERFLGPH
jgi:hypothetical protein